MSHGIYILSVFIHVIAACVWLGGMFFLILAFIPGIKRHPDKVNLIAEVSLKYRMVGTVALVLLLITGIAQLEYRGVQWTIEYFTGSSFGKTAGLKLLVFAGIALISFIHDYYLGNLTIKAWKNKPEHVKTIRLRYLSRLLGRVSFMLALLAVLLGVILSRGWY
jgi:putative copper resistance protein D